MEYMPMAERRMDIYGTCTTYAAFSCTTQANRVIAGLALKLHNIKMDGYMHLLLVSANASVFGTGLVEMGNVPTGHWTYLADGDYETIRCFGCAFGDRMRMQEISMPRRAE